MRTDDLIGMLAKEAGPAPRSVVTRRLWPVALMGLGASALFGVLVIGLVPMSVMMQMGWWVKFGYSVSLVAIGGWLTARLARPVSSLGPPQIALMLALALMGFLGAWTWWTAMPELRLAELLGHSWKTCPRNVVLFALPPMAAAFWALRGLAPTRPRAAGAAAGLFAGALGAASYALSCVEVGMSFVAVWYSLGIALCTLMGWLLGPRLLRW